ncbi:MAG: hypothetical protein IT320_25360 [Anaerolineae bacterium]|nr:hypothetical protein [Anaerolineae bacterium]
MNVINVKQAMFDYAQAYQRVYHRRPRDLHALDHEWVIVNGARLHAVELEYLTRQLQHEYHQELAQKRSVVNRLLKWLRQQ